MVVPYQFIFGSIAIFSIKECRLTLIPTAQLFLKHLIKLQHVLGDFCQRIYHLAYLFVRLLCCDSSFTAHYALAVAP